MLGFKFHRAHAPECHQELERKDAGKPSYKKNVWALSVAANLMPESRCAPVKKAKKKNYWKAAKWSFNCLFTKQLYFSPDARLLREEFVQENSSNQRSIKWGESAVSETIEVSVPAMTRLLSVVFEWPQVPHSETFYFCLILSSGFFFILIDAKRLVVSCHDVTNMLQKSSEARYFCSIWCGRTDMRLTVKRSNVLFLIRDTSQINILNFSALLEFVASRFDKCTPRLTPNM